MEPSYIQEAYEHATALTDDLTEQVATTSSSKLFDSYVMSRAICRPDARLATTVFFSISRAHAHTTPRMNSGET